MKKQMVKWALLPALAVLGACTTVPSGPQVMVLPGSDKSFEQFRFDDGECRQFALQQAGGHTSAELAGDAAVRSAAVGTVVGAAAGAALGGHRGAATGAGVGLLMGSAAGAGAAQGSAYGSQRQYDNAYVQCMYAKGHQVPLPNAQVGSRPRAPAAPPPPPPPGYPPPPPPAHSGH